MDLEYDNDEEIKVLGEPYPKTDEERGEWWHRYMEALNDDLDGKECESCAYLPAIIYRPEWTKNVDGKMGREIFLCEQCAEDITKRLNEIQKNVKERSGEVSFKDSWWFWTLIIYGAISGIIVFQQLSNSILKFLRNL